MSDKVLIVEDEREIADLVELYLKNEIIRFSNIILLKKRWNV